MLTLIWTSGVRYCPVGDRGTLTPLTCVICGRLSKRGIRRHVVKRADVGIVVGIGGATGSAANSAYIAGIGVVRDIETNIASRRAVTACNMRGPPPLTVGAIRWMAPPAPGPPVQEVLSLLTVPEAPPLALIPPPAIEI